MTASNVLFVCFSFIYLTLVINAELNCTDSPSTALKALCEDVQKMIANMERNVQQEIERFENETEMKETTSTERSTEESTTSEMTNGVTTLLLEEDEELNCANEASASLRILCERIQKLKASLQDEVSKSNKVTEAFDEETTTSIAESKAATSPPQEKKEPNWDCPGWACFGYDGKYQVDCNLSCPRSRGEE